MNPINALKRLLARAVWALVRDQIIGLVPPSSYRRWARAENVVLNELEASDHRMYMKALDAVGGDYSRVKVRNSETGGFWGDEPPTPGGWR